MSNLRMLKKKYHNALSTYQFSQSLLNASISIQEILNQQFRQAQEVIQMCCIMNKYKYAIPSITVLCGPSEMFPGDFKHIIKEKGDILMGKKVQGLEYDLTLLTQSLDTYEFKYMDFASDSVQSLSVKNILINTNNWNYYFYVDEDLQQMLYNQIWNFITITIKYNEQKYRGIAINKFVNNCENHLKECRELYYRARNSEITNQIIAFSNS